MAETKTSKNSWQLSWSHEKYDYFDRMLQVKDGKDTFYQSWGRKPVTNIGRFKERDTVYISCKKKCIAVGEIVEEFKEYENIIKDDDCIFDPKERDERHANKWYCKIKINKIYKSGSEPHLRGNQNTFCCPSKAFWKPI
jgi:hypothetical protein